MQKWGLTEIETEMMDILLFSEFIFLFSVFHIHNNTMGFFGSLIGQGLGKIGESLLGKTAGINGSELGGGLGGSLLPFKTGGHVKKHYFTQTSLC
jgi:hypothetical protein